MFLTDRKLDRRITELQEYRYRDVIALKEFAVQDETQGVVNPVLPTSFEGWDTIKTGDSWSGRDRYLWMHKEIEIPAEWKGRRVVGVFDFGMTGAGNNSGFESMLYVNGQMYQGVDANHKEVFFDDALCGTTVDVTFRLWSGLEGGGVPREVEHKIARADLAWLDEKADDFYYMSEAVLETIQALDEFNPIQHDLRGALDGACRLVDWAYPGSETFYETLHEADDYLNEKIDAMDKTSLINVYCVGHTHIDVAWLWRLKHTREKCSRSFSTVLRLMEMYPEYIFLQTQPQLYEYMKECFPDIFEKIKEKVAEGKWEADGAMWVEADCNLTSGESLTRQILLGSKFIKDEFGKDINYLWLPDVFGYSWALPQILKKAGINTFMTTKISWNQYNRMPHDTFIWKGIDGSEVLTHFITAPEPWNEPGSWFYTYNGKLLPKIAKGVWDAYSEKQTNKDLLIAYGYGDGGGGVSRDMLENRRRMDKIPGLPHVKTSTAKEYFEKLHETFDNTDQYVHTWDGELYLEYHRGTYTSHAHNKLMNRKMEQLYRRTEWMTVMEGLAKGNLAEAKQEELTKGWKHILTDQFHDIIPGSSICEVYEDSKKDYEYIESVAREVENSYYDTVVEAKEDTYTVWNSSGWNLGEAVSVPTTKAGIYKDEQGNVLPAQRAEDKTWVYLKEVPSMGSKVIRLEETAEAAKAASFTVNGREIETPFYQITLNEAGQISRLYDKTNERSVLAEGERGNVLQMFEDKPIDNDAWDIDIFYQEKMREVTDLVRFEVTELGELRLVIHMEWKYMSSVIEQDMTLYSYSRRIDFKTKVDYHEVHQLLKAAFPVDIRSTYATYDVQYGNVRRPNHWNTSWDQARFESVAHRWADLSERDYGVSILNDCKYGHDIKDNVLRITLIKAATNPDHLQDQGAHAFTYSLLPHRGDFVEGRTVQEAFAVNEPMQVAAGKAKSEWESFLSIDNELVELDAVKKSEDGKSIVIRFHEFAGSRQKVTLRPGFAFTAWAESDLRERQIGETMNTAEISMELKPYEIKTVLITL
ncbi:MAG: alpha-mannosidase [Lachnospiraceae bacterium]|nr:alpha-mannosidase [Lachnospiraceae bacterium]